NSKPAKKPSTTTGAAADDPITNQQTIGINKTWHTIEFSNNNHTRPTHPKPNTQFRGDQRRSNFSNIPDPARQRKPQTVTHTTKPPTQTTHNRQPTPENRHPNEPGQLEKQYTP
ncbi:hypothetical protein, partial [Specibacter sp. RAF43]|uniref:hypothetical protein n=1 Tax=Specibacter sp. RAF43 TaxID=3233057 RepID=UPI003F9537E8